MSEIYKKYVPQKLIKKPIFQVKASVSLKDSYASSYHEFSDEKEAIKFYNIEKMSLEGVGAEVILQICSESEGES